MAIDLPSDIVLDVARAADPGAAQATTSRLISLGQAGAGQDFSDIVDGMQLPSSSFQPGASVTAPEIHDQSESTGANSSASTYQSFEALILQNLIELMLPKDSSMIYGDGTAGEMWRSMLAQQLGTQVAKADRGGMFSKLFASVGSGPAAADHVPGPLGRASLSSRGG